MVAFVMLFAFAVPVFAGSGEIVDVAVDNAGFHCNAFGGNGEVDIDNYAPGTMLQFERIDATTWRLVSDIYVCPKCGSNEWISFSNKDGIPDGHNIQLYHPGTPAPEYGSLVINASAVLNTTTETIKEFWQREITPYQTITQYVSPAYSSVTATNAGYQNTLGFDKKNNPTGINVVPNSNHFTYAALPAADLENGVQLALVVGNKIDQVGAASIKKVGDNLVISFDGDLYASSFGAMAFNAVPQPSNGNIHSMKDKDLAKYGAVGTFNHDNISVIPCPPVGKDGNIYLYIHFDSLQYDLGIDTSDINNVVTKDYKVREEVIGTDVVQSPVGVQYTVTDESGNLVDPADFAALLPGTYTVVYLDANGKGNTEIVQVEAGQTATSSYSAVYTATTDPVRLIEYLPDIKNPTVITHKTVVK